MRALKRPPSYSMQMVFQVFEECCRNGVALVSPRGRQHVVSQAKDAFAMEKYNTFVDNLSAEHIDFLKVCVAVVFPDVLVNKKLRALMT